jgi:ribosome-binding factor A
MAYPRSARVGDQIRREISEIIQKEIKDPALGFVTITAVEMTADLKQAQVYYSVLGNEQQKRDSKTVLERAAKFIQQQLARRVRLKYLPGLRFEYDQSLEHGEKIDRLLRQIQGSEDEKRD